MVGRTSNYEDFRKALKVDFLDAKGDLIFKERRELEILMGRKGYRVRTDKDTKQKFNDMPTDSQTTFAWNFLTGIGGEQKDIDDFFSVETFNKRIHLRLTDKERIINGKHYRKGQFIPKRR